MGPRLFAFAVLLHAAFLAAAQNAPAPASSPNGSVSTAAEGEGEVISIDTERLRITLKHGAIAPLGMPAMTMVFRTADRKMLTGVKPGDAVRFRLARADNHFTVTQLSRR